MRETHKKDLERIEELSKCPLCKVNEGIGENVYLTLKAPSDEINLEWENLCKSCYLFLLDITKDNGKKLIQILEKYYEEHTK